MLERRTLLRGLAALPLVGKATAAIVPTPDVGALWHRYQLAQGAATVATERFHAAMARLPWWAQPGPSFIDHTGTMVGDISGWPATENYTVPEHKGSFRLIRISQGEIDNRYKTNLVMLDEGRAKPIRERQQADLDERLVRKQAEEEALNIPALSQAADNASDGVWDISAAIVSLPVGPIDILAAKVLIEFGNATFVGDTAETSSTVGLAVVALHGLLPHLIGELAIDVADAIADPERPMKDMRFLRGLLPSGEIA